MRAGVPETVDEYIAHEPRAVGTRLEAVRRAVRRAAPDAVESISYRIPAYALNGVLIYFAAFREHIGMYPMTASLKQAFGDELTPYLAPRAKSSAHFAHDKPLPLDLIGRMVRLRRAENLGRAKGKSPGKRKAAVKKR